MKGLGLGHLFIVALFEMIGFAGGILYARITISHTPHASENEELKKKVAEYDALRRLVVQVRHRVHFFMMDEHPLFPGRRPREETLRLIDEVMEEPSDHEVVRQGSQEQLHQVDEEPRHREEDE